MTGKLASETTFPWLISNVFDRYTGEPLANGEATRLFDWKGKRVGLLGLVEKESL